MSEVFSEEFMEALQEVFGEVEPSLALNVRYGKGYGDLFFSLLKRELPLWFEAAVSKPEIVFTGLIEEDVSVQLQFSIVQAGIFYDCYAKRLMVLGEAPTFSLKVKRQTMLGETPTFSCAVQREWSITPQS
jgi:hypothetical protein